MESAIQNTAHCTGDVDIHVVAPPETWRVMGRDSRFKTVLGGLVDDGRQVEVS